MQIILSNAISESLRLHPPLVILGKRCTKDTELELAKDKKVTVEKGTPVIVPVYSIHRDPDVYPNPEVFDPERFSEENGGVKHYKDKSAFLGFGDGPRICLGMKFALAQSKAGE
jgi:cytochrome P450